MANFKRATEKWDLMIGKGFRKYRSTYNPSVIIHVEDDKTMVEIHGNWMDTFHTDDLIVALEHYSKIERVESDAYAR